MKINDLNRAAAPQLLNENLGKNESVDSKSQASLSKAGSGSDKVQLSAKVDSYKAASQALGSQPDFRADRVQAIKSRIDAGTYEVSSRDVASKMLASLTSNAQY